LTVVRYFLLVFDRASGHLVDEVTEFEHGQEALSARFDRERQERGNPNIELVVLGARDRRALERTHARYFFSLHGVQLGELAPRLYGC
jgi:hypothetical protein